MSAVSPKRFLAFISGSRACAKTYWAQICKALMMTLALFAMCIIATRMAAAESSYDPRTWHFDTVRRALARPLDQPRSLAGVQAHESRQVVPFEEKLAAGSIVVETGERRLYFVLGGGKAIRYQVGVGGEGFQWSGRDHITAKREWPDWRPPADMIRREARMGRHLPAYVEGGPNNPMGARALYIGHTLYRIHGTNQPSTIGQATSSGCIRMANEDVIDLYGRVATGAQVIVRH